MVPASTTLTTASTTVTQASTTTTTVAPAPTKKITAATTGSVLDRWWDNRRDVVVAQTYKHRHSAHTS